MQKLFKSKINKKNNYWNHLSHLLTIVISLIIFYYMFNLLKQKKNRLNFVLILLVVMTLSTSITLNAHQNYLCPYVFPDQTQSHEATWLQWPHQHQYGQEYSKPLQQIWVDMTKALVVSEKVRIIVYDDQAKVKVEQLLADSSQQLTLIDQNVEYFIYQTDDVWVRDNGPIFAKDCDGNLVIEDWGFNGWGNKAQFKNCNNIPSLIGSDLGLDVVKVGMINEGGSVEIDGKGTLMGCRSSITNRNRNPNLTERQIQNIFKQYYGVSNFIWLDGKAGEDITDMHIDGFARFAPQSTIITMEEEDLLYWSVPEKDIQRLNNAKNIKGQPYKIIYLPLTKNDVVTKKGKNVGRGSYLNFYIANTVVLVPNYNDPNDKIANDIISKLYPERNVKGINVVELFANGGMIHCVTQQQPKNQ